MDKKKNYAKKKTYISPTFTVIGEVKKKTKAGGMTPNADSGSWFSPKAPSS